MSSIAQKLMAFVLENIWLIQPRRGVLYEMGR